MTYDSGSVAIAGMGVTEQGRRLGVPPRELRRIALERALDDAGLRRADIDGYIGTSGGMFDDLRHLGQLRDEGGATQVPDAEVALVSGHGGNGGVQNTWAHATMLLGVA